MDIAEHYGHFKSMPGAGTRIAKILVQFLQGFAPPINNKVQ